MARRISAQTTFTPVARADTFTFIAGDVQGFWKSASATQLTWFWEISISGQAASSSSPTFMLFSRDSTQGAGTQTQQTGGTDAPMNAATAALTAAVGVGSNFGTTFPQRDAANHLMNCSLNAFGGVFFWRANRMEEAPSMVGNTVPLSECSLSAFTGGVPGLIGGHVIYETA